MPPQNDNTIITSHQRPIPTVRFATRDLRSALSTSASSNQQSEGETTETELVNDFNFRHPDPIDNNSSDSEQSAEDRISRFSDVSSLTPEHRLSQLSHPQASPSIRNNLRYIDRDFTINLPSETLAADAQEADNEHPGGDSDEENPNSLAQVFSSLLIDEYEEDHADVMLEEIIHGAPNN